MSDPLPLHTIRAMVPPEGPPDWADVVSALTKAANETRERATEERDKIAAEQRGRELLRIHDEAMRAVGNDDPPSEAMMAAGNSALLNAICPPPEPTNPPEPETWDQEALPPPREWLVTGAIPAGRLTSLYGAPGIGKSTLSLQLAAAVMHGGCPVIPRSKDSKHPLTREIPKERTGRVLWLTWEDETDEILRRWNCAYEAGALADDAPNLPDPELLTLVQMRRHGGVWGPRAGEHRAIVSAWTDSGRVVVDMMEGHKLTILDPIASAYADNEIDRAAVRAFTATLDIAGEDVGCTTLLIGHPAKAAVATGGRYSGSTDWDAAPRARMELDYLTAEGAPPSSKKPVPIERAVTISKVSYGPKFKSPLWLRPKTNPGFALVEGRPPENNPIEVDAGLKGEV